MEKQTLEESLKALAQYEPHYSSLVKQIQQIRENFVTSLCHSVAQGKEESTDRFLIGKISTYDDILTILKHPIGN